MDPQLPLFQQALLETIECLLGRESCLQAEELLSGVVNRGSMISICYRPSES